MSNPSSKSVFRQFCDDLQLATQGVPGIVPSQVLVGQVEFFVGDNFYCDIAQNGYYFTIGIPMGNGSFWDFSGEFKVECFLFFPIPADRSWDWGPVNDIIGALIAGWAHYTQPGTSGTPNYTGGSEWPLGGNRAPVKFDFGKPKIRYHQKIPSEFLGCEQAFIVSTKFTFTLPYITDQAANPVIVPAP